jgi:hypothetical protein
MIYFPQSLHPLHAPLTVPYKSRDVIKSVKCAALGWGPGLLDICIIMYSTYEIDNHYGIVKESQECSIYPGQFG